MLEGQQMGEEAAAHEPSLGILYSDAPGPWLSADWSSSHANPKFHQSQVHIRASPKRAEPAQWHLQLGSPSPALKGVQGDRKEVGWGQDVCMQVPA